ncbi:MAG: hypothetical protein NVS2B12_42880 [Ktedonobacteraceae bacterium]
MNYQVLLTKLFRKFDTARYHLLSTLNPFLLVHIYRLLCAQYYLVPMEAYTV